MQEKERERETEREKNSGEEEFTEERGRCAGPTGTARRRGGSRRVRRKVEGGEVEF